MYWPQVGLPHTVAQQLLNKQMLEVERRLLPQNHTRSVDAARILNIPFSCAHTPADNHVYSYLRKLFEKRETKESEKTSWRS